MQFDEIKDSTLLFPTTSVVFVLIVQYCLHLSPAILPGDKIRQLATLKITHVILWLFYRNKRKRLKMIVSAWKGKLFMLLH